MIIGHLLIWVEHFYLLAYEMFFLVEKFNIKFSFMWYYEYLDKKY